MEFDSELERFASIDTYIIADHDDSLLKNNGDSINIIHLNIRSLNHNFEEFLILLESLDTKFDIIILTETWRLDDLDIFNIKGYNIFYSNGCYNQNDGVVVYVNKSYVSEFKTVRYTENTFANVTLKINNVVYNILSVYRLPSTNEQVFLQELDYILQQQGNNMLNIFTGDINIDIMDVDTQNKITCNEYLNIMAKNGYLSYINKHTRIKHNKSSCLDHIFIKKPLHETCLNFTPAILLNDTTDHFPILLKVKTYQNKCHKNKSKKNSYSQINFENLNQVLSNENWNDLLNITDPNQAYNSFLNKLNYCIGKSATIITLKSSEKKLKPWITRGLITSIRKRDKLKLEVNKQKNNLELLNSYKEYRNKINNLIRKVKQEYYSNKIHENKHNMKKVWEIINESSNRINDKNKIVINNQGKIVTDNEAANLFNNYFINVGEDLAKKITVPHMIQDRNIRCNTLFLKPVDETEIIKNINKLKNGSASGNDNISAKTLKKIGEKIAKPLVHIFNLCFENGTFPQLLKTSVVTPIYKKGDKNNLCNYRPISVINNLAKILEMSIKQRLTEHLEYNKILSKNQFGFKEKVGTEDAIFEVTKILYNSFEKQKRQIAVFLDLTKAFDTVSHFKLLEKLNNYGVRGISNKLLSSYLESREQYVKIGEEKSDINVIRYGIPQGTVLGPTLFSIYINELLFLKTEAKIIAYADDTVLLVEDDCWEAVFEKASLEFSKVNQWLKQNLLTVSIEKTKCICFSIYDRCLPDTKKFAVHSYSCLVNNKEGCSCTDELDITDSLKYLGVIIDKNLKWLEHIEYVNKKIRKLTFKFYHLRNIMPQYIMKTLYHTLAESVLRYGIVIWGCAYQSHLKMIKNSQKYLLKVILHKNKQYSSKLLFEEYDVFDLNLLYVKSVLTFTYKNQQILSDQIDHSYNTRNKLKLNVNIPLSTKTTTQRFLPYFSSKFYNLLPLEIKKINNLHLFNKKLSSFINSNKNIFNNILISH